MTTANHRTIIIAGALLTLGSLAAIGQPSQQDTPPTPPPGEAQPGGMHRGGPDRQLNMLTHVLNLTPDQQKGVKAILDQQATEMKALRDKAPADPSAGHPAETREARMTQMNQIHEESNTKIAALLDDNQKKTFAEWEARRKEQMERRGGRGGQGGPPPPDGAGGPPPAPNN